MRDLTLLFLAFFSASALACRKPVPPEAPTAALPRAEVTAAVPPPAVLPLPQRLPKAPVALTTIQFDYDQAVLRDDAQATLRVGARSLIEDRDIVIRIEGHCDERGSTDYNIALGQRRADAARFFLVESGVAPSRIRTVSYGEERPADPRSTEAAWATNRRAEFIIVTGEKTIAQGAE